MNEIKADAPLKVLIKDIRSLEKLGKTWIFKIDNENTLIDICKIIIQGEIIRTAGLSNEILIIDDGTGKAKVTIASQVPGNLSWVTRGIQCSVVGTLIENGKLPLFAADKIAKITNPILLEMWPIEVQELKDVITNKIYPKLPEDCLLKSLEANFLN